MASGTCLAVALPLPDGPPPAHTGGFGEPTCEACHTGGAEPGTPAATAAIIAPRAFEPGQTYDIVVLLRRPALTRGGFELAVRYASGEPDAARQAGQLVAVDSTRLGLVRDSVRGVVYARHTRAGTRATDGEARWMVRWTAPPDRQAVVFHAALLDSNDDDSNLGDDVLTRAQVVPPGRAIGPGDVRHRRPSGDFPAWWRW